MDQRRTGCSYPADEQTLKRLILLDRNRRPPSGDEANECGNVPTDSHAEKRRESRHHLITGRVLTQRSEKTRVTTKALSHMKSCWKMVRKCMHKITSHSTFDFVILLLIALNTIVLAMYYHGIPAQFRRVLDILNWVSKS